MLASRPNRLQMTTHISVSRLHTRPFIIFVITTFIINHSFSLPLHTQKSILAIIDCLLYGCFFSQIFQSSYLLRQQQAVKTLCFAVVRPSVRCLVVRCPSINTLYFISLLTGGISIKLATYIQHVSWHCRKGI